MKQLTCFEAPYLKRKIIIFLIIRRTGKYLLGFTDADKEIKKVKENPTLALIPCQLRHQFPGIQDNKEFLLYPVLLHNTWH
jgi:hypothetical protein